MKFFLRDTDKKAWLSLVVGVLALMLADYVFLQHWPVQEVSKSALSLLHQSPTFNALMDSSRNKDYCMTAVSHKSINFPDVSLWTLSTAGSPSKASLDPKLMAALVNAMGGSKDKVFKGMYNAFGR